MSKYIDRDNITNFAAIPNINNNNEFSSLELAIAIEEIDKEGKWFNVQKRLINVRIFFLFRRVYIIGTGKLSYESFYSIASNFLEEEDDEAMLNELKEAFRLYDREGNGYLNIRD